jgi:hypothetical protein
MCINTLHEGDNDDDDDDNNNNNNNKLAFSDLNDGISQCPVHGE